MPQHEFEQLVEEGYLMLPEHVREKISNVAILVEDEPSEEVREEQGLGPNETLLGLYTGIPLTARGVEYGVGATLPDTITLYRLPILDAAGGDPERVRQEVHDTIWHEFAHHFGMDEPEVEERERKRFRERSEDDTVSEQ